MKVYALVKQDIYIEGPFSSKELAEEYKKEISGGDDSWFIVERTVDYPFVEEEGKEL